MNETKEHKKVRIVRTVAVTILVGLLSGVALAEDLSRWSSGPMTRLTSYPLELAYDITQHADAQARNNWIEPADAILIQQRELAWSRYLRSAAHLPDWLDLGLEQRTRFESYDHPWRSSQQSGNGSPDTQVALRSRVRVGLGGNGPVRLLFEGQDARAYLNGAPGDVRDTTTVNEFDILQLLASLTVNDILRTGFRTDVHVGRMTLDFGRRRLIARNDFRNTTNAFDGIHWQINQGRILRFRAFVVEPIIRDEVRLDEQNKKSLFWGTFMESRHLRWFQADIYYLGLNDRRLTNVETHRAYSTFGGRLYKDPKPGEPDYEVESAWQIGTRGRTDHVAHFQHVDLGYTFTLPWTPRLVFHFDYASGDHKPDDSQDGAFDTLFGARRFEYGPTGIFLPFFRTNLISPGWRLIVNPTRNWTLQVKHRVWHLAQNKDVFGSSGLRDSAGTSGGSLGHDVELRAQYTLNANLDFDVGYVHWFKGSYFDSPAILAQLPSGGNTDSDYIYAQMRIRI